MLSLVIVSFVAGVLTILAPCVLPVLPVILAGSLTEKKWWYPYVITGSLAISIVVFTVLLKASTLLIDIPSSFWKYFSGMILLGLWLVYVFPHQWTKLSSWLFWSRANKGLDQAQNLENPFLRAIITGWVLGPVFSTCSPTYTLLLATVFPVSFVSGIFYTLVYSLWLAIVLLLISKFGVSLIRKLRFFADEQWLFRKILWLILVFVAIMILLWFDKKIETIIVENFDVTSIEESVLKHLPSIP